VSSLLGIFAETPATKPARVMPIREQARPEVVPANTAVYDDQIHALAQQLFFRPQSAPVHHVGFATVETSTETAKLCLDLARAVADQDRYDVGLIDAHHDGNPLQTRLQIPTPTCAETTWQLGRRLWMVPRQSWLPESGGKRMTDHNLSRLQELTTEFDFSILWCPPVSWVTASIGQICDGLVLVLTANKTRRLVAAQVRDALNKAQVPLLGTVLAERRFPVPQGLYRSL